MKTTLTRKRYLLIPAMIPVMLVLWGLVLSADRLHAWKYSENIDPPTQTDISFARVAFYTALLTPVLIGLIAASIAYYKKDQPYWPLLETGVVAAVYIMFMTGMFFPKIFMIIGYMAGIGIAGASCLMGGVIVVILINMAACVRHRNWGKFANSITVLFGGMLYLFWLYSFVIYIDT